MLIVIFISRILFVIQDTTIRAFNADTGELIRDLEGTNGEKLIGHQCDPNNLDYLYACTESGSIISWKWKSMVVHEKQQLRFVAKTNPVVNSFALIHTKDERARCLVTWYGNDQYEIQIAIFDLSTGFREALQLSLPPK